MLDVSRSISNEPFRKHATMDEKIKIRCSKCTAVFRERGGRVRNGYQMNCPHCNKLITFDSDSEDPNIRKALQRARQVRQALEAAALAKSVAAAKLQDLKA